MRSLKDFCLNLETWKQVVIGLIVTSIVWFFSWLCCPSQEHNNVVSNRPIIVGNLDEGDINKDANVLFEEGNKLYKDNKFEEAIEKYRFAQSKQEKPKQIFKSCYNIALCYYHIKSFKEAENAALEAQEYVKNLKKKAIACMLSS